MFGVILKATNSSFQKCMTFCRSIHVKKVMKLLAFIFEQPSYLQILYYGKVVGLTKSPSSPFLKDFVWKMVGLAQSTSSHFQHTLSNGKKSLIWIRQLVHISYQHCLMIWLE